MFFPRHCHCTCHLTCRTIPHIYAPIPLIFHPFLKTETGSTRYKQTHSKCSGEDVRLFTLSEWSSYRPVRTRSVTSNILGQQRWRNGTDTWRIRSCQREHLRLITHENILLNGDVSRRNGTETWRKRSCQREHLRLITHENILLNGDVSWRNGTETWRKRSCQREHLRLITHENILLNGDVSWRNGTDTWRYVPVSVNISV